MAVLEITLRKPALVEERVPADEAAQTEEWQAYVEAMRNRSGSTRLAGMLALAVVSVLAVLWMQSQRAASRDRSDEPMVRRRSGRTSISKPRGRRFIGAVAFLGIAFAVVQSFRRSDD